MRRPSEISAARSSPIQSRAGRVRALAGALFALLSSIAACPAGAEDLSGTSSPMLSRCAARFGAEIRDRDHAFGAISLDGLPWLTIQRTDAAPKAQSVTTTLTGNGELQRHNGTRQPFGFVCELDEKGQVLTFRTVTQTAAQREALLKAISVTGHANYADGWPLPHGAELRVQLLDLTHSTTGEVVTEAVVRSGWTLVIPFVLHVPEATNLDDRRLALSARLILQHRVLAQLPQPQVVSASDLRHPIGLVLRPLP